MPTEVAFGLVVGSREESTRKGNAPAYAGRVGFCNLDLVSSRRYASSPGGGAFCCEETGREGGSNVDQRSLSMDWRFALLMRWRFVSLCQAILNLSRISPRDMRRHVMTPRAAVMYRDMGDGGALSELEYVFGTMGGDSPLLDKVAEDSSYGSVGP